MRLAIDKQVIQASDLQPIFIGKAKAEISRQIRKLLDKKMLTLDLKSKRKYVISFNNSYLLRGVIKYLGAKGFLSLKDELKL